LLKSHVVATQRLLQADAMIHGKTNVPLYLSN